MAADVVLRLQAQVGNTQQVITALEKKVEKLGNKLQAASAKGRKGAKSMRVEMKTTGFQFAKAAFAAVGIATALSRAVGVAKQLRQEAEQTFFILEKSGKRLQIQAGLTNLQTEKAQQTISAIAGKSGVSIQFVERIATEAVSQGFVRPLKSGVVESLLAFFQATNQGEDADVELLVSSIAKQLTASGKKLTGKAALPTLKRVAGLFFDTPLQTPQLAEISKAAGVTKTVGVSEQDFLSAAVILLRKLPAAEASTGLKNTVLRLAAPEKTGIEAFEELGLTKEQVDLVGETLPQVLKLLKERSDKVKPERRLPLLKKIFGQKVITPAGFLISGAGEGLFEKFGKLQQNDAKFEAATKVAREGAGPAVAKLKAETSESQRKRIAAGAVTEKEAVAVQKLAFERLVTKFPGSEFELSVADTLVMGLPRALGISRFTMPQSLRDEALQRRESDFSLKSLESKMEKNNRLAEKQNELMEEQNDLLRQNGNGNGNRKTINRNVHR